MAWIETTSKHFEARHNSEETDSALAVLRTLEDDRERLGDIFATQPDRVVVVLHPAGPLLTLAHPHLLLTRQITAAAGRRYLTGWFSSNELHVLSPRALEARAAGTGSRQALALAPTREYIRLLVGLNNPHLPPPYRPHNISKLWQWAWLIDGAGQHFSGQTTYLGAAIRLCLREREPSFPPSARDSTLLAGTVFNLLEQERGRDTCIRLCRAREDPFLTLVEMFGLTKSELEIRWRQHVTKLSQPVAQPSS